MIKFIVRCLGMACLIPYCILAKNARHVVVPRVVLFADLRLTLTHEVASVLQKKVDQLIMNQRAFQAMLNRANLFFPIIEEILNAEKLPSDLKYQALFESNLIGNAVSHTKDVGFWQIQKATALDLRLCVDHPIDERMHLIESTKAAARLLKSHYAYFHSWLGALLAYNRGRRGALRVMPKFYYHAKKVHLNKKTDAYILNVLAYKLAFQDFVGKHRHSQWYLLICDKGHHGRTMHDIASSFMINKEVLKAHNHWLKTEKIPKKTRCSLLIPLPHGVSPPNGASKFTTRPLTVCSSAQTLLPIQIDYTEYLKGDVVFPSIRVCTKYDSSRIVYANNKLAIVARQGDSIASLAALMKMKVTYFRKINDISKDHVPRAGQVYFYQKKSSRAVTYFHVVRNGEDLWSISQKYAVQLSSLRSKNRFKADEQPVVGQILWLRFIRPKDIPVAYR